MTCWDYLSAFANIASILTAIIAVIFFSYYSCDKYCKRKRLEKYLKNEMDRFPPVPSHTPLHLMAKLGMTEQEIFDAGFKSPNIICKIRGDRNTGLAEEILFKYDAKSK